MVGIFLFIVLLIWGLPSNVRGGSQGFLRVTKRANKFCFVAIYNGRLWEKKLGVSAHFMHGSRVYKPFGMRNDCRVNNTFILMHGSRVYKLFGMGNGCRENSRLVSDRFRQSCI